jgi:protein TonB
VAIPSPIDTTWYLARQVDSQPSAIGKISPKYPELARQQGLEGSLKLMVKIDDLGRVREVEVVEATPPGVFDETALEAFRDARFRPAMKEGRPVRIEAYMRVEFRLE